MRPRIIDCTLREGMQARQCTFDVGQSAQLARRISAFGVDMVECGHPLIGAVETERVRAAVKASSIPVLAHSRCQRSDIDAVLATGAPWIGLFASFNELSLKTKFKGLSREDVTRLFRDAIVYAKSAGLSVRATVEDAGRTALHAIVHLVRVADEAGADRVCLADSVGILLPQETYDVFSLLKHEFPRVTFEHHVHNDQGLALANTLEAVRAGVEWLSTSCNGLGERAGITDTFELATMLYTRHGHTHFRLEQARALSELVEVFSRVPRSPMQPMVGARAFTHVARLHQLAVKEDSAAYTLVDPALFGGHVALEKDPPILEQPLFVEPFEKSATELKHHRHGPGKRFVMLDRRLLPSSPYYFMARKVDGIRADEPGHVDPHAHRCDSVFLFLGDGPDYTGLTVEVLINARLKTVRSPATVFIPAGARHSYRFVEGSGSFINFVDSGDYNQSLLEIRDETV
jgi:2-isopropylmalate synthase